MYVAPSFELVLFAVEDVMTESAEETTAEITAGPNQTIPS